MLVYTDLLGSSVPDLSGVLLYMTLLISLDLSWGCHFLGSVVLLGQSSLAAQIPDLSSI